MLRGQQRGRLGEGRLRYLGVILPLVLAGCPGNDYTRKTATPTVQVLLGKVGARQAAVTALRGKATVDHWDGKQRVKGEVNILVERPGSLHFRATDPAGGVAAKLATDGKEFQLLDVANNRFLVGEATPCNLARLVGIAMQSGQVIDLLVGGAPLAVGAKGTLAWDKKEGAEVITLALPGGGQEIIRLNGRGKAPTYDVMSAEERDAAGKVLWRLSHFEFVVVDGVRLPGVTKFVQPARKADVIVKWESRTPNPESGIPAEAWHLDNELTPEVVTCTDP